MTAPGWDRVKEMFQAALDRPPDERDAYVRSACGDDNELQAEVASLLAAHDQVGSFAERPAMGMLDGLAREMDSRISRIVEPGTRLGVYEIQALVGAGGMGEVYKARDTRLNRTVALKILHIPGERSSPPELRQRFGREAEAIAALNHPHICTLHDVGHQDGFDFLVMEWLDGQTLAERLKKGPLPIDQALRHAIEIADALTQAHRAGIVHRDLKPANIMLVRTGAARRAQAKLLDFGLAKLAAPVVQHGAGPTLATGDAGLTAEGTILGTLHYMAPEQLEGKDADARTDVFAFGILVYEMVTGRKAFDGSSQATVMAAILESQPPPISTLQPLAPQPLDYMVKTCLAKHPGERWQSMGDVAHHLRWIAEADARAGSIAAPASRWNRRTIFAMAAVSVLASVLTGIATLKLVLPAASDAPRVSRFVVYPPGGTLIPAPAHRGAALSPDGRLLVYGAIDAKTFLEGRGVVARLFVRPLDEFESVALPGTEGGRSPFFSPDGQWIGFESGGKLKKVRASGTGSAIDVCDITVGDPGGSWGIDDRIVFRGAIGQGIWRVSAEGGEPEILTRPDEGHEIDHHDPELLPGGSALLFTSHQAEGVFRVVVLSLASGQRTVVADGFDAQYLQSGHLVYASGRSLLAVPFDLDRLEATGAPVRLVDNVATSARDGFGNFALSATGSLVYAPEPSRAGRTLAWVSRSGTETPLPLPARHYGHPRLSPDGKRLAVSVIDDGREDIWIYDATRETFLRFTQGGVNRAPLWTREGRQLTYTFAGAGASQLVLQPTDNSAPAESLLSSPNNLFAGAWTGDSRGLIYVDAPPTDFDEIAFLERDGERRVQRLIGRDELGSGAGTGRAAGWPTLSADGRWLAFAIEGRAWEIHVQRFPIRGSHRQLVVENGREPVWGRDGRELFYRRAQGVFAIPFDPVAGVATGNPVRLFEGPYESSLGVTRTYDFSPDGERFVLVKQGEEERAHRFHVVLNWGDELKRRVPLSGAGR